MDTKIKQGPKIAEITGKVVGLLEPLSSEDRQRVINASLTLLGETSIAGRPTSEPPGATNQTGGRTGKPDATLSGLPPKAMNWMKQNGLTMAQIEDVFHIASDGAPIIASLVPGKGKKQQTYNAYVLLGVSRLLATGDATFDDKAARAACEELGCYDNANHAAYMTKKGNVLAGSKDSGWKLTAPGLKRGAELVRELTKEG